MPEFIMQQTQNYFRGQVLLFSSGVV